MPKQPAVCLDPQMPESIAPQSAMNRILLFLITAALAATRGLKPYERALGFIGVPVIASHAGSLAEVVQDAGIIVDPDDSTAIAAGARRLMEDAPFRADLIARGVVQARRFRWDDSGAQVLREFKRVAAPE